MKRRFEDQVVVVTGASRGIGSATALAFAAEGAKVVVNYRSDVEGALETQSKIEIGWGLCPGLPGGCGKSGRC